MEFAILILCVIICYMLGYKISHPAIGFFVGLLLGPFGVFVMLVWYALAPKQL